MDTVFYVYILSNKHHTVFYVGVTNDLHRRTYEHKMKLIDGFSKKYNITKLLYFEATEDAYAALHREKIVKKWKRSIKFDAIQRMNPEWKDLALDFMSPVEGDPATSAG